MSGAGPGLRYMWLLVLGLSVHASHFRGGIIMIRPLPGGGENEVSSITAGKVYGSNIATFSNEYIYTTVCLQLVLRWGYSHDEYTELHVLQTCQVYD